MHVFPALYDEILKFFISRELYIKLKWQAFQNEQINHLFITQYVHKG